MWAFILSTPGTTSRCEYRTFSIMREDNSPWLDGSGGQPHPRHEPLNQMSMACPHHVDAFVAAHAGSLTTQRIAWILG